ncbi:alpha/beta fold hydrolase [Proteobacteria bacterium 005FR1]|nr:alpha/beta fold hydrolase [Proteobacteria bacterium 005FR1]
MAAVKSMSESLPLVSSPPEPTFLPPRLLRHPDVQNLASSLGFRAAALKRRVSRLGLPTEQVELDCGDGVRLAGELNLQPGSERLLILFHGWEGSSKSAYMLSAALHFHQAGYSVFRLNFRDHGDSHHLNEELFTSTRLDEVINAVKSVQARWPHHRSYLAGFSLGGNFALRVGLAAPHRGIALNQVAAVCPVIHPALTLDALEQAGPLYEYYFVRKWRRSLMNKLRHFPHYGYGKELKALTTLRSLHDFFVPRFTPYPHRDDYFAAYALDSAQLARLSVPTTIINSKDDPITRADLLPLADGLENLSIEVTDYGSHCAFIQDFQFNSWIDRRLLQLFS